jgi:hypothetical protein
MAGDPRGRSVYLGDLVGSPPGAVVTFVPNAVTGALSPVFETGSMGSLGRWAYLIAGSDRVLGLWSYPVGHHTYSELASYPVDASGVVRERVRVEDVAEGCAQWAVADWRQGLVYSECWGVTLAYSLEPDGRVKPEHELRVCGPSAAPVRARVTPMVAVRGVLLTEAFIDERQTVCTYENPGLEPRADLGIAASRIAAAFDPADASMPPQIAMFVGHNEPGETVSELRLYSVGPGAQLRLQDTRSRGSTPLAFHPAGRLLFAVRSEGDAQNPNTFHLTLVVYSFEPEGRLTEIQRIDQPGWPQVAVTFPTISN